MRIQDEVFSKWTKFRRVGQRRRLVRAAEGTRREASVMNAVFSGLPWARGAPPPLQGNKA